MWTFTLSYFELKKISADIQDNPLIAAEIEKYKTIVNQNFLLPIICFSIR